MPSTSSITFGVLGVVQRATNNHNTNVIPTTTSTGTRPGMSKSQSSSSLLSSSSSVLRMIDFSNLYRSWFSNIPEFARFFVSGNIGNSIFFCIERFLYIYLNRMSSLPNLIEQNIETVSFFVGYLLQIISQHYVHALLVYGMESINTRQKYFTTLRAQYSTYMTALVGSTIMNTTLLRMGFHKTFAFVLTLSTFAVLNYFVVGLVTRHSVKKFDKQKEDDAGQKTSLQIWAGENNNSNHHHHHHNTTTSSSNHSCHNSVNDYCSVRGGAQSSSSSSSSSSSAVPMSRCPPHSGSAGFTNNKNSHKSRRVHTPFPDSIRDIRDVVMSLGDPVGVCHKT